MAPKGGLAFAGAPKKKTERASFSALVRSERPVAGTELFTRQRWRDLAVHFGFSRRQLQVARLVCEALESKQIAVELAVSLDTVRLHLREIYRKLQVNCRVGLVVKLVMIERLLPSGPCANTAAEQAGALFNEGRMPSV